jgi:hypothetical protein
MGSTLTGQGSPGHKGCHWGHRDDGAFQVKLADRICTSRRLHKENSVQLAALYSSQSSEGIITFRPRPSEIICNRSPGSPALDLRIT